MNRPRVPTTIETSGAGHDFEHRVQAVFVVLMLTDGVVPCLPAHKVKKIAVQQQENGYRTDDMIVSVTSQTLGDKKLLSQLKRSVIIGRNTTFDKTIKDAWKDFNNAKLFTKGKDVLLLISGPISEEKLNDFREIQDWARFESDPALLIKRVEGPGSNADKRFILKTIRDIIVEELPSLTDGDLHQFLRHYYFLTYDLDLRYGTSHSLVRSLISQYTDDVDAVWDQVIGYVCDLNTNGASIDSENVPPHVAAFFSRTKYNNIPLSLTENSQAEKVVAIENQKKTNDALMTASLIGAWDENNKEDLAAIESLAGDEYLEWVKNLRPILSDKRGWVRLKNGIWKISEQEQIWADLGSDLYDDQINKFGNFCLRVLGEVNPELQLPAKDRFMAPVYGKALKHSSVMREGVAKTMAMLRANSSKFSHLSTNAIDNTLLGVVRKLFQKSDWQMWASLNNHLPTIAEASPEEFLSIVENDLSDTSKSKILHLFDEESSGVSGRTYLSGLLWALEMLAWQDQYFMRAASVLGDLASSDPGGQWANRPIGSLTAILLPWLPQTEAPLKKREAFIRTLCDENPKVAWKLLLTLLPNQTTSSSYTYKPKFVGAVSHDASKQVSRKHYWDQIAIYAGFLSEMAIANFSRLVEVCESLNDLPKEALTKILDFIDSKEVMERPEEDRVLLWETLRQVSSKHKRFAAQDWALRSEEVSRLDEIIDKMKPTDLLNKYRYLFVEGDYNLFEEVEDYKDRETRITETRASAVKDILSAGDIGRLIEFAKQVENPYKLGFCCGQLAECNLDTDSLPVFLKNEDEKLSNFVSGYVTGKFSRLGWGWVDLLNVAEWSTDQKIHFLSCLPFDEDSWTRVDRWMGENAGLYWHSVNVWPYRTKRLDVAITKLLENDRPAAALKCLAIMRRDTGNHQADLISEALIELIKHPDQVKQIDSYELEDLIKVIQTDGKTDNERLVKIEWAFLPLLERISNGMSPISLEKELATNPDFFCETISLVYRSKKEKSGTTTKDEQQRLKAQRAYQLLHGWRIPPGCTEGHLDSALFESWLERVKKTCEENGRLEVALIHVGHVLHYSPPDNNGFWIDEGIAKCLNAKEHQDMRQGFAIEIFNSRGVHSIDPSGAPEKKLEEKYLKMAEEAEAKGFHRLGKTMRDVASSYAKEALRIVEEHEDED